MSDLADLLARASADDPASLDALAHALARAGHGPAGRPLTLLVDNGEHYHEDHCVLFVEVPEGLDMTRVIDAINKHQGASQYFSRDGGVVGVGAEFIERPPEGDDLLTRYPERLDRLITATQMSLCTPETMRRWAFARDVLVELWRERGLKHTDIYIAKWDRVLSDEGDHDE